MNPFSQKSSLILLKTLPNECICQGYCEKVCNLTSVHPIYVLCTVHAPSTHPVQAMHGACKRHNGCSDPHLYTFLESALAELGNRKQGSISSPLWNPSMNISIQQICVNHWWNEAKYSERCTVIFSPLYSLLKHICGSDSYFRLEYRAKSAFEWHCPFRERGHEKMMLRH